MIDCDTTAWVKAVCTEVVLRCRLGGFDTGMVLLFKSYERDSGTSWNRSFSPWKASRNGDVRGLIRFTKMLHKPDVFKENCSLNRRFADGTQPPLGFCF